MIIHTEFKNPAKVWSEPNFSQCIGATLTIGAKTVIAIILLISLLYGRMKNIIKANISANPYRINITLKTVFMLSLSTLSSNNIPIRNIERNVFELPTIFTIVKTESGRLIFNAVNETIITYVTNDGEEKSIFKRQN